MHFAHRKRTNFTFYYTEHPLVPKGFYSTAIFLYRKATKKYDLDSMLHQNLNNGSHSKHARSKGAKVIAAPQGKGHTGGQNQDEHKSLFLIAQGGWCRPENGEEYRQDKEKKPTGYQFDFWSVAAPAKKEKVWPKHPLGKPPGLNLATSEECELELHYATETGTGGRSSEAVTVATEVSL